MISEAELKEGFAGVVARTELAGLGERYEGKVRDCYTKGDVRILVTTDRLSAFDRLLTTIPYKGQVLNSLAARWFSLCDDLVSHHLIDVPDPNVMVVRNCSMVPFEVVVRGYLAGSAWRSYEKGGKVSGVALPPGLREFERLPEPVITPSTKAEVGGHDEPVSEAEILASGLVERKVWEQMRERSLALFERGSAFAAGRGLLLADTKYEFGLAGGKLLLVDEIHTLDSSRYWVAESYPEKIGRGEAPEMLDKEPVRRWLASQGFMGEGAVPEIPDEMRLGVSRHYVSSFERILGEPFVPVKGDAGPRIERNLVGYRGE